MRDVDREPSDAPDLSADPTGGEVRGTVLDVVKSLLADNDSDADASA